METKDGIITKKKNSGHAAPIVTSAAPNFKKDTDFKQHKQEPSPLKFRSFQDFYLTQGKRHNKDFLSDHKSRHAPWQCQIRYTPNNAVKSMAGMCKRVIEFLCDDNGVLDTGEGIQCHNGCEAIVNPSADLGTMVAVPWQQQSWKTSWRLIRVTQT